MEHDSSQLIWMAPEFDESPIHQRALLILLVVFLAIIIYALIENSSIMAMTFVLLGTITFLHSRKPPKTLDCAIASESVVVEKEAYMFENIESFWIIYEEDEKSLSLKTRGSLIASVRIPLGTMNPNTVRDTLLKYIREVRYEPTLVDTLSRFLHI
ncbi:MAG: hypothetical protein IPJ67_03520 [Candidatus Moraniibacteriota bacterium]|nr:MAG: hypothetical protein IPJ67_03520 [Candidatus Moranbacteria bacterium]